jgi:hypothetical protein
VIEAQKRTWENPEYRDKKLPQSIAALAKAQQASVESRKTATAERAADVRPILEELRDQPYSKIVGTLTERGIRNLRGSLFWDTSMISRLMKRLGINHQSQVTSPENLARLRGLAGYANKIRQDEYRANHDLLARN